MIPTYRRTSYLDSLSPPRPPDSSAHPASEVPAGIEDLLIIALPSAVSRIDQDALFGPWEGGTGKLPESNPFDSPVTMGNHLHPHPEMCLLLAGRCRLTYGKRSLAVPEGSLVLLPGNLRHGETFSQAGEPYSLAWWILPPAKPVFQVTAYGPEAGFSVINRIPLDGMGHEMDASLERLQAIVEKKHPPALIELKEALLTMVLLLMRQLALFGTELDQQGQVVRMALTYIEENLNRPIDLGEVGREVHLSPNYLTSLFRRYTGYSMGHMIRRLRVQRACTLLEDPRRQIQEIAREVGIPDPFTFSKVFRSVQGESPTRYRKRLRFVKSDRHS